MIRRLLLIVGIILLLSGQGWAANSYYFIDPVNGNNSYNGRRPSSDGGATNGPWQTSTPFNAATLAQDDHIYYAWDGTDTVGAVIHDGGASGHHVVIDSYKPGATIALTNPSTITSFTEQSGWETAWSSAALSSAAHGSDVGRNRRQKILKASILKTGTHVRLTFKGGDAAGTLDGASIGPQAAATNFDYSSAPTRVTFGGNNTYTFSSGEEFVSDDITFNLNKSGEDYAVHMYWADTYSYAYNNTAGSAVYRNTSATDDTMVANIDDASYTATTSYYCLEKIEVNSGSYYTASLASEPEAVIYNQIVLKRNSGATTAVALNEWDWAAGTLYLNVGTAPTSITVGSLPVIFSGGTGTVPPVIGPSGATLAINTNSKNYVTIQNLICKNAINLTGTENDVYNVLVKNVPTTFFNGGITSTGGTSKIYNCASNANGYDGIYCNGGTLDVQNTEAIGNGRYGFNQVSGTITPTYCYAGGNATNYNDCSAGTGCLTDDIDPKLNAYRNTPYRFVLTSDDYDVTYWGQMLAVLPSSGKLTACCISSQITGSLLTSLQGLYSTYASQLNLANHSYSHQHMSTYTNLFQIGQSGLTNPAVNVTGTQMQFTCDEGGSKNFNVDQSSTYADLIVAKNTAGSWTLSALAFNNLKLSGLKTNNYTGGTPYQMQMDVSAPNYQFWANEVGDCETWLSSNFGITCYSFAYPYGEYDASLITYLNSVAIVTGSQKYHGGRLYDNNTISLTSIPMYAISCLNPDGIKSLGTDEASIRKRARRLFLGGTSQLRAAAVNTHHATELTVNQVYWLTDELSKMGATFNFLDEFIEAIRGDGTYTTADGGVTYTKAAASFTDLSDYRPKIGSPLVGVGNSGLGITRDILGNPVIGTPNIGPYESGKSGGGGLSPGLGLGGNYRRPQ